MAPKQPEHPSPERERSATRRALQPEVGVVIPSRGPRELLRRALASVSAQTVQPREVVVVLDGANPELESELAQREDLSLRVLVVDPPRGASHARNVGIASLEAPLDAFLDDDDEWLPSKLERQLPLLESSEASFSRVLAQGPGTDAVWPRRGPDGLSTSDYLFDRRRPWSGAGLILTSTLVARTELMKRVAFDPSLSHHHDWDWALRASTVATLAFCAEPLAVWHVDHDRRRLSMGADWQNSLEWARSSRDLFTARAYAGFLLVNVYTIALRARDRRAALVLAREAVARGRPTVSQWVVFAGLTVLSPRVVERFRALGHRSRERQRP
jgi:glycosyltransferase involved in cell wall biosynthesis